MKAAYPGPKIRRGGRMKTILAAWLCIHPGVQAADIMVAWTSAPAKKKAASGLAYIFQGDDSSALTVIEIFIKGGKGAVPPGKNGLAFLASRLAVEIPDSGKVQDLMKQSSRIFVSAQEDYCLISLQCLSENLPAVLKLSSEIILNPLFSGLRIDGIKDYMSHEARIEDDDAVTAGHKAAMRALWGDTGYGGSCYGDQKTLKSVGKKDVTEFYRRMFSKKNAVFSIVSDLEEKAVVFELEKYFAGLPPGPGENPVAAGELRLPDDRNIRVVKDQKQCYVARACPLPPLTGRRYALGFLLETLLGKGVGSRLWELRFKEKLAYSVNARASQTARGGLFEAYLETERGKKGTAEIMLRDVMNDLFTKGLTEEELQVAKVMSKTQFLRANETKVSRARSLGAFEIGGLGAEFLSGFFNEIDAVSLDEANGFIRDVLDPAKALWIVVGPEDPASGINDVRP